MAIIEKTISINEYNLLVKAMERNETNQEKFRKEYRADQKEYREDQKGLKLSLEGIGESIHGHDKRLIILENDKKQSKESKTSIRWNASFIVTIGSIIIAAISTIIAFIK